MVKLSLEGETDGLNTQTSVKKHISTPRKIPEERRFLEEARGHKPYHNKIQPNIYIYEE
jgi:hypothetical protein